MPSVLCTPKFVLWPLLSAPRGWPVNNCITQVFSSLISKGLWQMANERLEGKRSNELGHLLPFSFPAVNSLGSGCISLLIASAQSPSYCWGCDNSSLLSLQNSSCCCLSINALSVLVINPVHTSVNSLFNGSVQLNSWNEMPVYCSIDPRYDHVTCSVWWGFGKHDTSKGLISACE